MAGPFYATAMVDFYHYTSESAADMIIYPGVIMKSSGGGPGAMFGTGKVTKIN